jgi:hypothetical protein
MNVYRKGVQVLWTEVIGQVHVAATVHFAYEARWAPELLADKERNPHAHTRISNQDDKSETSHLTK